MSQTSSRPHSTTSPTPGCCAPRSATSAAPAWSSTPNARFIPARTSRQPTTFAGRRFTRHTGTPRSTRRANASRWSVTAPRTSSRSSPDAQRDAVRVPPEPAEPPAAPALRQTAAVVTSPIRTDHPVGHPHRRRRRTRRRRDHLCHRLRISGRDLPDDALVGVGRTDDPARLARRCHSIFGRCGARLSELLPAAGPGLAGRVDEQVRYIEECLKRMQRKRQHTHRGAPQRPATVHASEPASNRPRWRSTSSARRANTKSTTAPRRSTVGARRPHRPRPADRPPRSDRRQIPLAGNGFRRHRRACRNARSRSTTDALTHAGPDHRADAVGQLLDRRCRARRPTNST